MRALHVVKTGDGARWAALQVRELVRAGVQVEVALPTLEGRSGELWKSTGARLHALDLGFPMDRPWLIKEVLGRARGLVERVQPDVIHSHFVSTTLTLRAACGNRLPIPRLFQVPGPLHLEHGFYRRAEMASAGPADRWIASSRYTRDLYLRAGVPARRVFLSYYGTETDPPPARHGNLRTGGLRARLGLPEDALVAGNINLFYRPKRYLGQFAGIKGHERVIEALRIVTVAHPKVYGVLLGGPWGDAQSYFERLRARAHAAAPGRILLPGPLAPEQVLDTWKEFDCAVHVPLSENCGGVVEPLFASVPVIAGRVGGLPEVVIDGVTGRTVPPGDARALAIAILDVLADGAGAAARARAGSQLARRMFSPRRTAAEIRGIYEYVVGRSPERPAEFDPGDGEAAASSKPILCV